MNKISGTIITLNNETQIETCILSLKSICDEIIVVDSLSSDSTREIAAKLGAQVIKQDFLGDGPQKAFASSFAKHEWFFSLDADERLEDDLVKFINQEKLEKLQGEVKKLQTAKKEHAKLLRNQSQYERQIEKSNE